MSAVKIAGAVFLILGGILAGMSKSMDIKKQLKLIADIDTALSFVSDEIDRLHSPLPELFYRLGLEGPDSLRDFFLSLSKLIGTAPFSQLWQTELEKLRLSEEFFSVLNRLGTSLGRYEPAAQTVEITLCRSQIQQIYAQLKAKRDSWGQSWPKLGACLGAMLAVILF